MTINEDRTRKEINNTMIKHRCETREQKENKENGKKTCQRTERTKEEIKKRTINEMSIPKTSAREQRERKRIWKKGQ